MEPKKMKRSVWKKMPRSLLLKVASLLPLEVLISMRVLCREWRDIVSNALFRAMWRSAALRMEASFLIVRYRYVSRKAARCYSTVMGKWYTIQHSFFIPKEAFLLKDAKQGLIAARLVDKIAVGNPVSRRWIVFNPPGNNSAWEKSVWSLLVPEKQDEEKGVVDFKLLIDSSAYDSRTSKWEELPDLPGSLLYGKIMSDGGDYYYYLCEDNDSSGYIKLIRGSMDSPALTETMGKWRKNFPVNHILINYRGEIGMVADTIGVPASLTVHVLDAVTQNWMEKSKLPDEMSKRILKERQDRKKLAGEFKNRSSTASSWQLVECGRRSSVAAIVPRDCSGLIIFDSLDDSWRWIDDPGPAPQPFSRQSGLFSLELRA